PLGNFVIFLLLLTFNNSSGQNTNSSIALDKIVETTFEVRNFELWKPLYLKDSLIRRQHGIENIVISSQIDHPLRMMNVSMIKDVATTKAYMKDRAFLERSVNRGVSNIRSEYYEVLRFNPDAKESRWVIMNFKVEDYEKWLKDFDEGETLRSDAGLIDVIVARNIDHPLKIQVILDIKDLKKAKALMTSEILKERMKNAGVIGKAHIEYYEGR
ncbi:MAG: hypothetical protein ACXWVV_04005, partial [Kaistella sp.]